MKNYWFAVLLLSVLVISFPAISHAKEDMSHIILDNKELKIKENEEVQNIQGTIMVPLRLVAEGLGYSVTWDNINKAATIKENTRIITLKINDSVADINGEKINLTEPSFLVKNTVFVPLRFIGEQTGISVKWDNSNKTVLLESPSLPSSASDVEVTDINFLNKRLTISVNHNVIPSVFTMTNKDRIVVDLPNSVISNQLVMSGLDHVGNLDKYPEISDIRYSLFDKAPSVVRVVIELNSPKSYKLINDNNGHIVIDLEELSTTSRAVSKPLCSCNWVVAITGWVSNCPGGNDSILYLNRWLTFSK